MAQEENKYVQWGAQQAPDILPTGSRHVTINLCCKLILTCGCGSWHTYDMAG